MEKKQINNYTEDLSFDYTDIDAPSMFTPSISPNYVRCASSLSKRMKDERAPLGLHRDLRELDFLKEDNTCFYYPYALTSAGHSDLNIDKEGRDNREGIFTQRDKSKTLIIGDSGGYQIGKGVLKFDWKNFESESNNQLRMKILRWLESIADISMTLDVPPWGIGDPKCGIKDFNDCLEKTLFNHDFFINNRVEGATRLANILQGRDQQEVDTWWEAMKDLPFEGWAFAGILTYRLDIIMKQLITMRDGGYLDKKRNWIHVLGLGKFEGSCIFTEIQKNIRRHIEPTFTISLDASSPFLSTAKGMMYSCYNFNRKNLNYASIPIVDNKNLAGSKVPFPLMTPIGRRLTMGDMCYKGHDNESKGSWDTLSYMLMMNHNTYMHVKGLMEANRLYALPVPEIKNFVPPELIEFKQVCAEIFTSATPYDVIESNQKLLREIGGSRRRGQDVNTFENSDFFAYEDGGDDNIKDDEANNHLYDDTAFLDSLDKAS